MQRDKLLEYIRELLLEKNVTVNMALSQRLSKTDPLDDVEEAIALLETYDAKHTPNFIKVDKKTSTLYKDVLVAEVGDYIDQLSPNMFERLSALFCRVLGCEDYFVTKHSHDQGIDFIGVEQLKIYQSTQKSYVIGQAKKYTNQITIDQVRELAGSILLLKHQEFAQSVVAYKDVKIKSHTPIRGLIVTSHFFKGTIQTLCDNSDIIPIDFVDLVYMLIKADQNKVISFTNAGVFDKKIFDKLLRGVAKIK